MLRVSDVAKQLNIRVQTVYSMIEAGVLPAHRFGAKRGAIRVSEQDLAEYVASCRSARERNPVRKQRPRLKHISLRHGSPG